MSTASNYWKTRFSEREHVTHHSQQNRVIANDFLRQARFRKPFADALNADRIVEIGCGTGELAQMVKELYCTDVFYATDFSRAAVKTAQKRYPEVNYWVFDILDDEPFNTFDVLISSNVLEHFKTPHTVINNMFHLAPLLVLLVPYKQPITDVYETEGGAGHAYEFNQQTFESYKIHDLFLFKTHGWQHSSAGEDPQQLAVLISQKNQ